MLCFVALIFLIGIEVSEPLQMVPERSEVSYFNPKYIRFLNMSIRKVSRHSPYTINLEFESFYGFGNNVSIDMALLENLSGRYQPTLLRSTYKLCDFLYNETYIGKMYAKQLPGNWTCPFPAGEYHFLNLVNKIENFPFTIPFTWASVIIKARADFEGWTKVNSEKEALFTYRTYLTVIQKPKQKL